MSKKEKLVLIIEDEVDTAEMFAQMLRLSGYRVIKIMNSAEAMQSIEDNQPDAILLDLMMPNVSGMEILNTLSSHPKLSKITTIIVSAMQLSDDIRAGFQAGAVEYLTKPVRFQALQQALQHHLSASNQ